MRYSLPYDKTGYLLFMDDKIRKKIIEEYKKGKSSLKIVQIVGLSKPTILKVLNDENIVRKKDRCKSLKIEKIEGKYVIHRICPKCNKPVKVSSTHPTISCRNYYNTLNKNCKKCSLELQVGEGNPFYGKKHSVKTLNKISKSRKGKATGNSNSMSKIENREKARKNLKQKWDSGKMERVRKIMSEKLKETRRLGKIKSGITSKKEKEIILFLKSLGFDCIPSYRIDTKICDVYIPSLNLIIEYFGDYWHCNPKKYDHKYFNQKKNMFAKEIWEYDSKKIDLIKNNGYNLEVIWESELKNDNKLINKVLEKYVKSK